MPNNGSSISDTINHSQNERPRDLAHHPTRAEAITHNTRTIIMSVSLLMVGQTRKGGNPGFTLRQITVVNTGTGHSAGKRGGQ